MKAMKKLSALLLVGTFVLSMNVSAMAASVSNVDEDIVAFYNAEGMNYITEMPSQLQEKYANTIALADRLLVDYYGNDVMLSTDRDFVLDRYCENIKLGLVLDLTDKAIVDDLKSFTDAAAEMYVKQQSSRRSEAITEESDTPIDSSAKINPRLSAGNYNATAAVNYARTWTEENKKLCHPDFKRYDADCTNFVSQVLYAGGIPQISGGRKDAASWFYEWGLVARPSYTWGGAQNLYDHLKNHSTNVSRITTTADIEVGDIISFDTDPNDNTFHIGHSVVVTEKNGNTWDKILVTYHSTDREDYPASKLVKDAGYIPYAWSIGN